LRRLFLFLGAKFFEPPCHESSYVKIFVFRTEQQAATIIKTLSHFLYFLFASQLARLICEVGEILRFSLFGEVDISEKLFKKYIYDFLLHGKSTIIKQEVLFVFLPLSRWIEHSGVSRGRGQYPFL